MQAPPNEIYHIPVGGLPNNRELGVNRGKFALKATDLQVIFEPVILQIIQLVRDQIAATRVPVRAVLLVGGFGASTYLKERLRNALHESVQVLQPPKAWSAVVEGAVMKGLAQNSPNSSTSVRVKNRVARKHYGVELSMEYNEALHWNMDKRWDGLDGKWRVTAMHWLIKRGDAVSENEPFYTPLDWTGKVSEGRVKNVRLRFYCDESRRPAPVARDSSVKLLCVLDADLSRIPESELDRRRGADGFYYYQVNCMIEVIYHSASTEYALIHKNKRYSTVTAEYV